MRRYAIITTILVCSCYSSSVYDPFGSVYPSGPWPTDRDGLWEHFEGGEFDLQGISIAFTPQRGATVSYTWDAEVGLTEFPLDPGSGATSRVLHISDDDFREYSFERLETLQFYGEAYEGLFVSSNGYVTFGEASSSLDDNWSEHFRLPAVSLLRHDLDPSDSGRIIVDEWATMVSITYEGVPAYGETEPNDVQLVLHTNGRIELHYVRVFEQSSWLVGLSNGLSGSTPGEVNFVGGATNQERCWDGIDNDGDRLLDCGDPDCADDCGVREYDCFNGRDDEGDGLVDCEDPDCAYEMGCYQELECLDREDNDDDDLVDCDDPDCWGTPSCEVSCQGYWEAFEVGEEEDLQGKGLMFIPSEGTPQGYSWDVTEMNHFSIEPYTGETTEELFLGDDDFREHPLALMGSFRFFGRWYESVFVSSNGYITFGRGNDSLGYEPWSHFELPSIAAVRGDLDPGSIGAVVVDETTDFLSVTYLDVPWFGDNRTSSFQTVLYASGEIMITYLDIGLGRQRYITGLSNGCDTEGYPPESDFIELNPQP